jgi:hypothetical protein
MGIADVIRARDRLLAADDAGCSAQAVCAKIVEAFHDVARFDRCAVMTTDPETLLPSGGVVEGFDSESCGPFWENELLDPDSTSSASWPEATIRWPPSSMPSTVTWAAAPAT